MVRVDLIKVDKLLYSFLEKSVDILPMRFVKMVAYYYTDARIRKLYWKRLGVIMGEGTYSNIGMCVVPNDEEICVVIGDHVSISPNVTFICNEDPNNGTDIKTIPYVRDKITRHGNICIKDNVWLGANVTILSGITIGECTVVGAGAVVTKDLDPYSIYAGVPARKIRSLKDV